MAAFTVRGLTCTVIACLLLLAPTSEAITCGMVVSSLSSCLPYVLGKAPTPSGACCGGIKGLYAAARLPADRRAVCTCLKGFAGQLSGVNYGLVASVPRKCGVSLPYAVSPSTDCNKIP